MFLQALDACPAFNDRHDIVRNVPADFQLSFDVPAAAEGDNYKAVLYFLHPTSIQPFLNPIVLEPGKAYYTRP